MIIEKYQLSFFALLQAGLWEKEVRLSAFGEIDFADVLQLAEEQSVVGPITAGIEHIADAKLQKKDVLQFIGQTIQLEQRNSAMNYFIGVIVEKMREAGIHTVLVKGQGVGQCYHRPLWRSCGDVDLLMDAENYCKAKGFLTPLSASFDDEDTERMHMGLTIDPWLVELHGTLHTRQLPKVNRALDEVQKEVIHNGKTRIWNDGATDVYLPAPDEDVMFIYSHIIQHYFGGGIGLRQICDWCRLLWTYKDSLNYELLKDRIERAGLLTECKVFAALAVDTLGMPVDAMPLYSLDAIWSKKARRVLSFILKAGNFGHNRDSSFRQKSFVVRSAVSLWRYTCDTVSHFTVFPIDPLQVWWRMVMRGMKSVGANDYRA